MSDTICASAWDLEETDASSLVVCSHVRGNRCPSERGMERAKSVYGPGWDSAGSSRCEPGHNSRRAHQGIDDGPGALWMSQRGSSRCGPDLYAAAERAEPACLHPFDCAQFDDNLYAVRGRRNPMHDGYPGTAANLYDVLPVRPQRRFALHDSVMLAEGLGPTAIGRCGAGRTVSGLRSLGTPSCEES